MASNVCASEEVMPAAESVRVPSRSKRTQVHVRVTVGALAGWVVLFGSAMAILRICEVYE
ncbi:cytochrome C oxidase subunit I [Leifsonia xyli subsp. cynodontis DSM 46306]|uniref:Uncharacterized protein n=1 Tax=Leifsonia xyli subsp. cynodontis DSM 46306 TaxID=1389489 RepID=U3P250_LEIXC|nr:cytochrome C oxidase subunit I [Leifsonia xyli subsp. cynodontis DSM 46306]